MEVILRQDVSGLGFKNDTVKVRPGYGRNYLIPNGYAVSASDSEKRRVAEDIKQAAHKAERIRSEADALAQKIADLTLIIGTKAGESGKIFGAVTALQVSDALKAKGFDKDRRERGSGERIVFFGRHTIFWLLANSGNRHVKGTENVNPRNQEIHRQQCLMLVGDRWRGRPSQCFAQGGFLCSWGFAHCYCKYCLAAKHPQPPIEPERLRQLCRYFCAERLQITRSRRGAGSERSAVS